MDFSLISQTSLFRGYTPSETEELLRRLRASTRRFVRDSAVYTAGKPVSNIGIVLSGTAQIENNDIWGNTSILGLVKPGEVFAEAYACVPGEPMMVDVIATEDTEILFVNVPEIFRLASSGKGNYTRLIQNLVIISARKTSLSPAVSCTPHPKRSVEDCSLISPIRQNFRAVTASKSHSIVSSLPTI